MSGCPRRTTLGTSVVPKTKASMRRLLARLVIFQYVKYSRLACQSRDLLISMSWDPFTPNALKTCPGSLPSSTQMDWTDRDRPF
ncbi:hypothetical protein HMI54_000550 [Coelomomyces lativittatus]|nr:hypothetical protein HMI54_000550 [Coelomomyces lativittatus]